MAIDVIDFEEIMNDLENERKAEKKKSSSKEDKKQPTEKLRSNYSFLYSMSKNKIERYIKNTTKYKTIDSQIKLLIVELKAYRSLGKKDLEEQTRALINSLKDSISDLKSFASEKNIREIGRAHV